MTDRTRHRQPLHVAEEAPDTPVGEHTHEQPRSVLVIVLTVVTVLLSITVGWLLYNSYKSQRDIADVTSYIEDARGRRDEQNAELNARINQATCDVLDQLPAGELLDPVRAQYGCGPGIPVAELDPAALENLAEILAENDALTVPEPARTDEPAGPTSEPGDLPPGAPPGAQPFPNGQAPTTSAPTTAPSPTATGPSTAAPSTTTPAPLADLSGVTDRVCNALGICL